MRGELPENEREAFFAVYSRAGYEKGLLINSLKIDAGEFEKITPLALDGAISMESVKHKAIHDPVAGQADILLVPFIEIGNVLYKACTYIAGKTMASTICGASCPVIITSRADTPDSKYYSILMAVLRCLKA